MPELPEVQTVVTTLRPLVAGLSVARVDLMRADIVTPTGCDFSRHLTGATITAVDRRGKRIVFSLANGNRFYIHLGMTGRLTMEASSAPMLPHTHLVVEFERSAGENSEPRVLRFRDPRRFGGIWWLGSGFTGDENMGPEPLTMRSALLVEALRKTKRPIKTTLLDQSVVAGLGNIYVDESLFLAGIHPLTIAADLSAEQITKLNRSIKTTLKKAINHRGSTLRDYFDANGNPGGFQKLHAVYDRAGEKCRKCKTPVDRIVLGGRSTHFCPRCQAPKR